jgi:hypothetical protein
MDTHQPAMPAQNKVEVPRFFYTVGWSWLIMGVLGILSSLLGLLMFPAMRSVEDAMRMQMNTEGLDPAAVGGLTQILDT